jgi:hypothetical protein
MQKDALFILSFSERREGGSFFQALQKHNGMRDSISSGITACLLKRSGHFSVLVVEPTQNWNRDDPITTLIWWKGKNFPLRNLLLDALMWSCLIEIRDIGLQDTM